MKLSTREQREYQKELEYHEKHHPTPAMSTADRIFAAASKVRSGVNKVSREVNSIIQNPHVQKEIKAISGVHKEIHRRGEATNRAVESGGLFGGTALESHPSEPAKTKGLGPTHKKKKKQYGGTIATRPKFFGGLSGGLGDNDNDRGLGRHGGLGGHL